MNKFLSWLNNSFSALKELHCKGKNWIGIDGLLNLETSALLVMIFQIFFPVLWSIVFSFILIGGKSAFDKSKGHLNEKHDIICALLGIAIGLILAIAI